MRDLNPAWSFWTQSFPPLKQNFQGTSITFAWARVCKRSFGADVRSLFSIWMTTDNGKFLFLWNQNLLSFVCLSVGTVYSRQSEPRHDAESHGKYGSECSATWRYRCIMGMKQFFFFFFFSLSKLNGCLISNTALLYLSIFVLLYRKILGGSDFIWGAWLLQSRRRSSEGNLFGNDIPSVTGTLRLRKTLSNLLSRDAINK